MRLGLLSYAYFISIDLKNLIFQGISAQCIGNALLVEAGSPFGYTNNLAYGAPYGVYGERATAPTSGGGFLTTSFSPISPTGIHVVSENAIEGGLFVIGELPFLSAIAFEGALPTAGAGGINYGCGDGATGIVSEGITPAYAAPAAGVAPGRFGYGAGNAGPAFAGSRGTGFGYNGLGAVY